jgi:hypothetical protein
MGVLLLSGLFFYFQLYKLLEYLVAHIAHDHGKVRSLQLPFVIYQQKNTNTIYNLYHIQLGQVKWKKFVNIELMNGFMITAPCDNLSSFVIHYNI